MKHLAKSTLAIALLAALGQPARADSVTDWNTKLAEFVTEAKMGTPPAVRITAIVQTAAWQAAQAAAAAHGGKDRAARIDAAIAAAHRATLAKLMPAQQAAIDAATQAALAQLPEGPAKAAGIAMGEQAAAAVLAARLDDGAGTPDSYRPHTTPGAYVPTAPAAVTQWAQRRPWLMVSPAQFRPAAPPALSSEAWAREFEEVKLYGSKASTRRSAEQTDIARFWDYSLPSIYHGVLRSVALQPGRDTLRNARMFAVAAQAMDDALISVFEAKYHYGFWRPVTAIRNGDGDGHGATQRDAGWSSLIDAPMHPEYPSGHSILAGAVGAVIEAEVGKGPMPVLSTASPSAKGATRRWTSVEDFVQEVSDARIWGGIHYRFSTAAGAAMGRSIGQLATQRELQALR